MLVPGSVVSSDKFVGCTLAAAVGDALGMPVEKMNGCEIRSRFGEIRNFISPSHNPHVSGSFADMPIGAYSDDTQRTIANMKAFIEADGRFDMDILARNFVEVYQADERGWGRSTRRSGKRLYAGKHWSESGEPDGAGNGVIICAGPLGLWHGVIRQHYDNFIRDCIIYAQMTHLGTPAIVGGAIHALSVASLASRYNHGFDIKVFLNHILNIAMHVEKDFNLPPCPDKISQQIMLIIQRLESEKLVNNSPENIAVWFGGGTSYAPNSFGLSYALFARNPFSFKCVFDAVNAGGDTDSNASIAGSLVGALNGSHVIPENLVKNVEDGEMLQALAKEFFNVVTSARGR